MSNARVQDKDISHYHNSKHVAQEGGGRVKHSVTLDTPANCVSINKDCSQIVVAGRNVFKVFSIEEDKFVEKVNLRTVRNPNLSYCTSDVSWNYGEDHILASASTNGAVVIWNLNMNTRSKQDRVLAEHKRTATRVNFHKFEHHLLISGSLDGYMKLFDLRKKEVPVSTTFNGKSDAIRDVQFNPLQYFQFAAAFDSGNVQVWDFRYPNRMERQFTAHSGPCFSLDWHLEDPTWLASAGRDRLIKIWDMQSAKPRNLHQIQTIASVAQIKWRPQRKFHIASCSFILDYSVNVWDIRRPYIPFAAFEDHKDVVTGIVWKHSDPHVFYSSSKDCTLYQHLFRDATRPADKANPVGVDISVQGSIALATNDKLVNSASKGLSTRIPSIFRRGPDRTEQFTKVTSICNEFDMMEELSTDWLLHSARRYKLTGCPVDQLCDHNGRVAESLGRIEVAQSWYMLQFLYGSNTPLASAPGFSSLKQDTKDTENEIVKSEKPASSQDSKSHQGEADGKDRHVGDTSTGVSEEESDAADGESDQLKTVTLTTIASGMGNVSHSDFFFGDGTMDQAVFDYNALNSMTNSQDWNLPIEAFQPRVELEDRPNSPDPIAHQGSNAVDSPSSANDSEFSSNNPQSVSENTNIKQEILGCLPFQSEVSLDHFSQNVCDMLHHYADKGDVQMCVTVLIVLGDKIQAHIDETTQEQWLMSYIDLLSHFQLWCQAAEVIKLCNHPRVNFLNQQSTLIHTNCSNCSKPLVRGGWLCDRCKGHVNTCSICHHPVKGLYAWCQGCSHGGHLQHMKEWLAISKHCPAGCGHLCEFTT